MDVEAKAAEKAEIADMPWGRGACTQDPAEAARLEALGANLWHWQPAALALVAPTAQPADWFHIINGHWFYLKRWLGDAQQMANTYSRLSRPQTIALLEGFCRADGEGKSVQFDERTGEPTGVWRCSNSSFPLIDHISLIGQLAGGAVDLHRVTEASETCSIDGNAATFSVDHWTLSFNFNKPARLPLQTTGLAQPEEVSMDVAARGYYEHKDEYGNEHWDDSRVYCITVEGNANFLTQRLSVKRGQSGRDDIAIRAHPVFVGNCLQEVQANAFDDYFHPQLQREGYEGLYKRKTRESMSDDPSTIDGCAIFYRSDRFSLLEQYGIEYNEAARQQTMDRKALRRLMRGNIALVVVLEELTGGMAMINGMMRRMRKKRVCVANTHMYWDPDYADVKLWQTYVLTQELEKLILHRQLPLVLCGDFNSLVDSSVYEFLMTQQVQHGDDVYGEQGVGDVCHVLPSRHPHAHHPSLTHHLALTSAYASIGEPKYTNFTGHFVGVLDYVFYSRRLLRWVSVMEVEDERKVRQYTALPSPLYASDHLPLVVELEWINDM